MKVKFLLLFIFTSTLVGAQCDFSDDVETQLIITEARLINANWTYLELTNVGTSPIFLNEFKIGKLSAYSWSTGILDLCNDSWYMNLRPAYVFLPNKVLMPGNSWVITTAFDFGPEFFKKYNGRLGGNERPKQPEMYKLADKLIHRPEPIDGVNYPEDSVSNPVDDPEQLVKRGEYANLYTAVNNGTYFIEHHYSPLDSAVVDQVGGFFDGNGGRNYAGQAYDVAGVYNAMSTSVLVRKYSVKQANLDFANHVGVSIDDSDWLPIQMPQGYDQWRDAWWTIGNHGDYVLDENTLEPTLDGMSVDFAAKQITVPWGVRRLDDIMRNMKKKKGLAWNYILNGVQEDSLYRSARTGDKLIVYAVGNTLTTDTFDIVVSDPTSDDNMVIPIDHESPEAIMTPRTQNGILDWPRVTKHESGIDTITGKGYGLEFDLRKDSLFKYLEKPEKATWEIVYVDGVERADLKNGDKLKVTSENGSVKEYFIQVQTYLPSDNANLSAITFPDLPEKYHDFLGWTGDTIPSFSAGTYNYKLEVPYDIEGVPALVPTTQDYNASVKTTRAQSVTGSKEDRTITFEVTAEDDSTTAIYSIELIKEKHPDDVEPYFADPFVSEFVCAYLGNSFIEIYNPGSIPVDLRNYAFGMQKNGANPYAPILSSPGWLYRYTTYVPGLKFIDSLAWEITPELLIPDVNVNPILNPGECFVMSKNARIPTLYATYDVCFVNGSEYPNLWNENTSHSSSRGIIMPPNGNRTNSFYMYKVLNDSIKEGLKPVQDPNDFEVIDVWGMDDGGYWIVGNYEIPINKEGDIFKRKPHITKGNPEPGAAFAPGDPDACEWIPIDPDNEYAGLPNAPEIALGGIGTHYMIPITKYRSTVNSKIYKVSPGHGPDQEIKGLVTGTTISEFLKYIYKEDENQTLTFKSSDATTMLADNAVISNNDILEVMSADSTNTTYYRLDVTDEGLSTDAVLSSNVYTIEITTSPDVEQDIVGEATISGIEYGSTLKNIMSNINAPTGADVAIINSIGDYVALNTLNYDTIYEATTVSPDFALDVVAEDSRTRIVYDLVPNSSESDAFLYSDIYLVSQVTNLIEFVPYGITFDKFLDNVIVPNGSEVKIVDKTGFERTYGVIKEDDKVVVTSENGEASRSYFISLLFPDENSITYLAYVISETYNINQVEYKISGTAEGALSTSTAVSEFMQQLTPSVGATMALIDADGNVKISGNIAAGDILQVTSGDGEIVSTYTILLYTSARMPVLSNFGIYPNPTTGVLNVSGLEPGNNVRIFDTQGQLIMNVEAEKINQTLRLENVPDGLFLIIISDGNEVLGRFKAVKQ